jgi:hypothetical protein
MRADAYGTRDYATLAALVGVALTVAKTIGPVAAGLARTSTDSCTGVLIAVAATAAIAAIVSGLDSDASGPASLVISPPRGDVRLTPVRETLLA